MNRLLVRQLRLCPNTDLVERIGTVAEILNT